MANFPNSNLDSSLGMMTLRDAKYRPLKTIFSRFFYRETSRIITYRTRAGVTRRALYHDVIFYFQKKLYFYFFFFTFGLHIIFALMFLFSIQPQRAASLNQLETSQVCEDSGPDMECHGRQPLCSLFHSLFPLENNNNPKKGKKENYHLFDTHPWTQRKNE